MTRLFLKSVFCFAVFLVSSAAAVWADISYTSNGQLVTEDFDSLASTGTPGWTDDSTIKGWFSNRTTYLANTGSGSTGGLYSFGVTGTNSSTDRAIGSIAASGADPVRIGIRLINGTGNKLTRFTITYDGEQWRKANNANQNSLSFEYVIGNSLSINSVGTAISQLNFTGPISGAGAASALDGNALLNRQAGITFSVSNITWLPGQELLLRWSGTVEQTNKDQHGLAIDNFNFVAVPEPTTFGLGSLLGLAALTTLRRRRK